MLRTSLDFEVVDLPQETFAFVVRRVTPDESGEFIRGALDRVAEFAAAFGGVAGPPTVITTPPDERGARIVEAGWPVAAAAVGDGAVEVRPLHPTRALRLVHVGAREELDGAFYADLYAAAHERGLRPESEPRERYLDDSPGREEPVTEVVWPVS
jgi:hypothetical protein